MTDEKQKPKGALVTIREKLMSDGVMSMFKDALPDAVGDKAEEIARQFAEMVYMEICQRPDLQKCTMNSLIKSASQSAGLGIPIDARGLGYLIPYKNQGVMEAQFQISYLGLIDLAYRSGKVKSIGAHCIYESEKKNVTVNRIDGRYSIEHPFSWEPVHGDIVAVYATAEVADLGPQSIVLRIDEVERYRKISKAPNSPAWKNHFDAMAKKTAIRQLCKFLPKSLREDEVYARFTKALAVDEQQDFVETAATAEQTAIDEAGKEEVAAVFEEQQTTEQKTEAPKQTRTKSGKGKKDKKESENKKAAWRCENKDCSKPDFDKPKSGTGGIPLCPNCLSAKVVPRQTAQKENSRPDFMEDD